MHSTASSRTLFLVKLILLCSSLLIGLGLAEGSLRLLGLDHARLWEPDPIVGWRSIPEAHRHWTDEGNGFVKINSRGYRDRERSIEKPPGVFRIAIFGDSMTEAVQVNLEQTFTYLLEEKLRERDQRIEVLNFGVSGYSPIQELLLFKQEGPRYRPDLVIFALFLDNDVSGVHPALSVVSHSGPPYVSFHGEEARFDYSQAEQSYASYHREPLYSLRKYSSLYRFVNTSYWKYKTKRYSQNSSIDNVPQRFLFYQTPLQPIWEQAWAIFDRVVMELAAEARQQHTQFVILSVPAAQVVNGEAWQNILRTFPAMAKIDWYLKGPEQRLRDFTREHHMLLVQPYKAFEAQTQGSPFFFGNVGHMTPQGHQLMATLLRDFLAREALLPLHQ